MEPRAAGSDFGDRFAEIYDEFFGHLDPTPAVAALERLAGSGSVLELGVGTGRIAPPLAARGVHVHGIDASTRMLDKLRQKTGGPALPVTVGDFADFNLNERFGVVFVAFNTLFALATQEAQVRCFERAAAHLGPGGVFVVEAFVPDPSRFDRGQSVRTIEAPPGRIVLEASLHDAVEQRVRSSFVFMEPGGLVIHSLEVRYAWPSELDLMARLTRLRLRERWADWTGAPFTGRSTQHVSLYEAAR